MPITNHKNSVVKHVQTVFIIKTERREISFSYLLLIETVVSHRASYQN